MMVEIKTKEDFDELMLGQEKFKNFIEVNKSQNEKDKCATDQKILINRLIRSGQMPKLIICDFEGVLSKTNIFDFTNEDGSTTVKLNEWHEYIANSAIKYFDALLKNEQIHFSDDNGGPLRFCCWVSRLSFNSIKNFNDIIARNDITLKKSDGSYTVFNEFKDKLANESIKNLNFIIDESGKVKEDNLGFKDFIKDATNLRYFAPETFDRINLNNPEHRNLLGIKSEEQPDKIVFGWNLLRYLSIIFTFGLAYLFGWSQKLFANAIANDWYNGSYIARLQQRKKDIEMVVEPIKTVDNVSIQNKQWDSKSDDEIIKSQTKRISKIKIVAHEEDTKHEENTTKNNIDIVNTNKGTLNSENEYGPKTINNEQKENKNIKKDNEIIKSATKKTLNTDYSNNNDQKTAGKSNGKQTKTDQRAQINKNIDLKTKKNIIKNNNESGQLTNEPSNKQTKTGQSTQVNKNVELKHEKNIAGNSTNTIKMDNKVLNSKNDNKNESGQKIVNSSKKGNNQTTKKDDIHKQELSKGHNTKKDQTAKNNNSEKMHVPQDEKKATNEAQKHKQNYGVADFLADFNDATNMNFIFLDNQDAQRQLQDKLSKLDECKTKYNEILEVNKDALQKYESKHKIKIVNTIDYCMNDTKLELDNRQKKLGALQFKNFYPAETPSLNKPFLAINSPFQNSANSNLNSPFFNPCPPPHPFNNLYQDQKPYMINETEMDNKLF